MKLNLTTNICRNGNIRNFLAQKAAYVNHGEKVCILYM